MGEGAKKRIYGTLDWKFESFKKPKVPSSLK